ncbi:MAG: peptidoglycan bridge formation glycyltransferase FemA/FemB family protein [Tildeniella nuda ZEHNDER 1965/U140]|jgi:lipid II:glycine glycyltransferase (peptidoglycan interpeptide bridge formation enzyme)|nr:peptidoglycan bridge formation glycyltransferase FemA/FemB family protein [Tildeniella nuda ZEHNDER 1965/U140]
MTFIQAATHTSTQKSRLVLRQLNSGDHDRWDTFLQSSPTGCFMQSWAWSEFKELEGYQVFRYGVFVEDQLVGGSLFYFYPRPHTANLLSAPGAPFLLPEFEAIAMPLLLQQAETLAADLGAIALRIEPSLAKKPAFLQDFVRAPMDLLPSETLLIDLRPTDAERLAAMKPKGRYNLRLSQRYGVTTQFTTDSQTIPIFYDLFWETVARQQFFGEPYGFFINLCQTLFAANLAEIGLATWRGEVLSAMLVVYWGDRATYLYGGRSPNHAHVMPNYALHWAAMQRAQARGCILYDFYGYTQNPSHPYAKFSQFKRQFGGTPTTTIGAHDYFFYDRLADTLIGLLQRGQK